MCVLIFSTTFSETLLIQGTTVREIIINVRWSSRQVPLLLPYLNDILHFSSDFQKNTQIPNLMKIISMEAELFRAGGRTDGHNTTNSRFSKFANEPNNMVTSQNILVLHLTDYWHLNDIYEIL